MSTVIIRKCKLYVDMFMAIGTEVRRSSCAELLDARGRPVARERDLRVHHCCSRSMCLAPSAAADPLLLLESPRGGAPMPCCQGRWSLSASIAEHALRHTASSHRFVTPLRHAASSRGLVTQSRATRDSFARSRRRSSQIYRPRSYGPDLPAQTYWSRIYQPGPKREPPTPCWWAFPPRASRR